MQYADQRCKRMLVLVSLLALPVSYGLNAAERDNRSGVVSSKLLAADGMSRFSQSDPGGERNPKDLPIVAYADRLSVQPGETI